MPTRKIADLPEHERCQHPEHNPPMWRVFAPGVYEHECPACGHKQTFTVSTPQWDGPMRFYEAGDDLDSGSVTWSARGISRTAAAYAS